MGYSAPHIPQQTLSSPQYARQDRAEIQEHRVELGREQRFLQLFSFIYRITVP